MLRWTPLIVAVAIVTILFVREWRERDALRENLRSQQEAASERRIEIQDRIESSAAANETAERVLGETLDAVSSGALDPESAFTAEMNRLGELIRARRYAEALEGALRLYQVAGNNNARLRAMSILAGVGRGARGDTGGYQPALDVLREIRDADWPEALAHANDQAFLQRIAMASEVLGENMRTTELFTLLPPDSMRRAVGLPAFPGLMELRRYEDAAEVRSFDQYLGMVSPDRFPSSLSETDRELRLTYAIEMAVQGIEILTGLGRAEEADQLTQRLLALDDSDSTRELIRRHVERARLPR